MTRFYGIVTIISYQLLQLLWQLWCSRNTRTRRPLLRLHSQSFICSSAAGQLLGVILSPNVLNSRPRLEVDVCNHLSFFLACFILACCSSSSSLYCLVFSFLASCSPLGSVQLPGISRSFYSTFSIVYRAFSLPVSATPSLGLRFDWTLCWEPELFVCFDITSCL